MACRSASSLEYRIHVLDQSAVLAPWTTRRRHGRIANLTRFRQQRPRQRGIHFDPQDVSTESHLKSERPALPTILARARHRLHVNQGEPAHGAEAATLADHRVGDQLDFVEWEKCVLLVGVSNQECVIRPIENAVGDTGDENVKLLVQHVELGEVPRIPRMGARYRQSQEHDRQQPCGNPQLLQLVHIDGQPGESEEHPDTQRTRRNFLQLFNATGKLDQARPLVADVLASYRKRVNGPNASANDMNGYAWELLTCFVHDLRDPVTALEFAKKAVEASNE